MIIEIPNQLGFSLLDHVPQGTNVEEAVALLLTQLIKEKETNDR